MEDLDIGGYHLNLEEIAKDKEFLSVTRLLATQLMENPYLTVADFMRDISDDELAILNHRLDDEDSPELGDHIVIAEMLAIAEGCSNSQTFDEYKTRIDQLSALLATESLARKGFITAYRENMSFHPDMLDKPIAKKL